MSSVDASEIMIVDRLADVAADPWDALLGPGDMFLSFPWLQVIDRVVTTPQWYLMAGAGPEVSSRRRAWSAVLTAVTATADSPWVLGRPDTLLARSAADGGGAEASALVERWPDPAAALLPSVVLGGRHMGHSRLLHVPGTPVAVLDDLLRVAEETALARGARSVCLPFVDGSDVLLRDLLAARGYLAHRSGTHFHLDVPETGFEGYLTRFPSRRRVMFRSERRKIAAAGVHVTAGPLAEADLDRLAVLETHLMIRYGHDWSPAASRKGLEQMLAVFGDETLLMSAELGGDVIGFTAGVHWRDEFVPRHAGFDYARQGALPLYFETLYYAVVDAAPGLGIRRVQYGLGSEEAKLARGCTPEPQYSYLKPLGPQEDR